MGDFILDVYCRWSAGRWVCGGAMAMVIFPEFLFPGGGALHRVRLLGGLG